MADPRRLAGTTRRASSAANRRAWQAVGAWARQWLSALGLVAVGLLAVVIPLSEVLPFLQDDHPDLEYAHGVSITMQEARLAAARPHLQDVATVGILWIGDRGPVQAPPQIQERMGGIAQYALAPAVIVEAPEGEMYLGVLQRPGYLPPWVLQAGLRVEADLRDGLVLLRPPPGAPQGPREPERQVRP